MAKGRVYAKEAQLQNSVDKWLMKQNLGKDRSGLPKMFSTALVTLGVGLGLVTFVESISGMESFLGAVISILQCGVMSALFVYSGYLLAAYSEKYYMLLDELDNLKGAIATTETSDTVKAED